MNLADLPKRNLKPAPWSVCKKIPWNDPAFSRRMLREHLSQAYDAASRRFDIIDQHCAWIHTQILGSRPARVLDLGCGPGLYIQRLARLGHTCYGIDFSPASIEYARQQAADEGLDCRFELADMRSAEFSAGFDLVMLIFGEFNAFHPADARRILEKAHAALVPGGRLVLEVHTLERVRDQGLQPPRWFTSQSGLFSERPHLCLKETFWYAEQMVETTRYYVIDVQSNAVEQLGECIQGYSEDQYQTLLAECGFNGTEIHPSLAGEGGSIQDGLFVLSAHRA